jgi:RsiW-degrading membrane proteinase PrsW (M82 family)
MKLTVKINDGSLAGRTFELETGFLTVGRGENCSIRFDPHSERIASKQHAFIEARPDGFYLTDNQSTNGTLLNGERIESPAKLSSGDTIQFGRNGTNASVSISSAAATAPSIKSPEQFREQQAAQFQQAITQQPVSLQNSFVSLGLGKVELEPKPSSTGKYVGIAVTIFALIFFALVVVLIMFFTVGIVPAVIGAAVAFTPAIIYLLPFIWIDRYDPEPLWLFSLAYAWGALVAVVVSFFVNTFIAIIVSIGVSPVAGQVVGAVISAPVFEEGSKGLGLVVLLIFFRRYFDDILDGIVFAGVIALGFATVENVLYYGRAIGEAGLGGLIVLFVMRGILSPFAHVTFTSMTGIGCGISRESHNKFVRILLPVIGYAAAVTLHAIWNGMAVIGGLQGFLAGYLLLEIPFFLIFVGFALYIMYRQSKILKEMLAMDIARGLIPQEHATTATSAFKSSAWVLGGLFNGKFRARNRYVQAIGKLGLSYWHIQRATAAQGQTASFQQNPILREEVLRWRDKV